jgi:hypothetical protein
MTSCDHRLGDGNRCIFCGADPYPDVDREAFAKTQEAPAPTSTYRSRLDGPPNDGHDYTWTRHVEQTSRLAGHPIGEPIYSYAWVRNDELKRESRRNWWVLGVLLVLFAIYTIAT